MVTGGNGEAEGRGRGMSSNDIILVVDDEEDMRLMVCRALEREGFQAIA